MALVACSGLGKTCESLTYAVAPQPSSGWNAADDAFFVKHMCKQRSVLDLGRVDTPQEREAAGRLMRSAITVAHHRDLPDLAVIRDPARFLATPSGWRALLEPTNQLPWRSRQPPGATAPQLRWQVERVAFGALRGPSQACVTISYADMPPGPKPFVQDHRFVKGADGQWRFDGFEPSRSCAGGPGSEKK